jgi:hypothetical protein
VTLYNQKTGKNLAAKDFFEQEIFPVFFNHEKHLINIHSSSFFQKVKEDDLNKEITFGGSKQTFQFKRLKSDITNAMKDPELLSGAILASGKAAGIDGTTSNQVTNLALKIREDDVWESWIGVCLGITLKGGLTLSILDDKIIWALFQGWKHYRKLLDETKGLKGNQVETWNGIWLSYILSESLIENDLTSEPFSFSNFRNNYTSTEKLDTVEWVKFILKLSKVFPNQTQIVYTYQLGSTNTTIGFIPIHLQPIRGVFETAQWLFGQAGKMKNNLFDDKAILDRYTTRLSFAQACRLGAVGLFAIEPHYFSPKREDRLTEKEFETLINRIIWFTAILNNMEYYELAAKLATHLQRYRNNETGGRTVRNEELKSLLSKSNRKAFIDGLTVILENERIVKDAESYADDFKQAVDESLKMPMDVFPMFVSLIRFLMEYQKHKPEVVLTNTHLPFN